MVASTYWRDQVAASHEVDIRPVPEGRRSMTPGKPMLYPTAQVLLRAIREIPAGRTLTPRELKGELGRQYGVEYICPVTMSRNLRLVAEGANEAREAGEEDIAPIWRVLTPKESCLQGVSFDPAWLTDRRQHETTTG
jgi:hypothetical protein